MDKKEGVGPSLCEGGSLPRVAGRKDGGRGGGKEPPWEEHGGTGD